MPERSEGGDVGTRSHEFVAQVRPPGSPGRTPVTVTVTGSLQVDAREGPGRA